MDVGFAGLAVWKNVHGNLGQIWIWYWYDQVLFSLNGLEVLVYRHFTDARFIQIILSQNMFRFTDDWWSWLFCERYHDMWSKFKVEIEQCRLSILFVLDVSSQVYCSNWCLMDFKGEHFWLPLAWKSCFFQLNVQEPHQKQTSLRSYHHSVSSY